jgi:hypothetical protein
MDDEKLTVDDVYDELADGLECFYACNVPKLLWLSRAIAAMAFLVVGEIVALFVNLALA